MSELIREACPKASKDYRCQASEQLFSHMCYPDEFEPNEVEILKEAYEDYTIKKGDYYTAQTCKGEDGIYTFRAKTEVLEIYLKYDINDWCE